jgi:hypothetical protein
MASATDQPAKASTTRNQRKHENRKAARHAAYKAKYPVIEQWVIGLDEHGDSVVKGTVHGHRDIKDGESLVSSPLVRIGHLFAKTMSGSTYALGQPNQAYLDFRERHGLGPISTKVFLFDPWGSHSAC